MTWTLSITLPWWAWLFPCFLMSFGGLALLISFDVADLRSGERRLWRFMVVRLLTLSLGVGVGTSILVSAVLG